MRHWTAAAAHHTQAAVHSGSSSSGGALANKPHVRVGQTNTIVLSFSVNLDKFGFYLRERKANGFSDWSVVTMANKCVYGMIPSNWVNQILLLCMVICLSDKCHEMRRCVRCVRASTEQIGRKWDKPFSFGTEHFSLLFNRNLMDMLNLCHRIYQWYMLS